MKFDNKEIDRITHKYKYVLFDKNQDFDNVFTQILMYGSLHAKSFKDPYFNDTITFLQRLSFLEDYSLKNIKRLVEQANKRRHLTPQNYDFLCGAYMIRYDYERDESDL